MSIFPLVFSHINPFSAFHCSVFLYASFLCFAIGQIFMFVISKYIMDGTSGKIDGSMFATLFVFLSIFLVFCYWSSITEGKKERMNERKKLLCLYKSFINIDTVFLDDYEDYEF